MSEQNNKKRFDLDENEIPRFWYNISADSPVAPAPVFDPGTKEPISVETLLKLFPMPLIEQEVSMERYIPIPDEVRDIYKLYRPTPPIRASRLEKVL